MIKADIDVSKDQTRPRLVSYLPYYFTRDSMIFSYSNQENFSHTTTTGSRIGVNLKIIFFIGLQSPLLKAHARFLGLLKTRAIIMRRPGYSHDMKMVMTQICLDDLMSKMRFISHLLRSCDWSQAKIIWLVTCQDHVIDESCDHNITIVYFLRRKLR